MKMSTCGTCKNWVYDVTNPQDRDMNGLDRRPCALANSPIGRATFLHSTIPACNKFKVLPAIIKKESTQKKIDGLYAAIGKERK